MGSNLACIVATARNEKLLVSRFDSVNFAFIVPTPILQTGRETCPLVMVAGVQTKGRRALFYVPLLMMSSLLRYQVLYANVGIRRIHRFLSFGSAKVDGLKEAPGLC